MIQKLLPILLLTIWEVASFPTLDGRIIGGVPVRIEEFPYQVSVQNAGQHMCGGSIISKDYVLTAAHCTESWQFAYYSVRIGTTFKNTGGQVIDVKKIFRNPQFNPTTMDYDIAVLELFKSIEFGLGKAPIQLISEKVELDTSTNFIVSGWGLTEENGEAAHQLQAVTVPLVSHELCQEEYTIHHYLVTDRMICAGEKFGGKDSCQGDSGGPLVADGVLVGIVSWGYGCARPEIPGVYSKISEMRDFIRNVTNF